MGDDFQLLDIVLFAAIAAFLVFRLRSVLGRRTGLEQKRDLPSFRGQQQPAAPERFRTFSNGAANNGAAPIPQGLTGLAAVKAADPSFNEAAFVQGARGAFGIIVSAFAAGDKAALKPLLSPDVFDRFAEAIDARVAAKETLETTLAAIKAADLGEASFENGTALVTVKFISDQSNVTRSGDGKIVDGDAAQVAEHTDFWTFARIVRSSDPNWTLVATKSP